MALKLRVISDHYKALGKRASQLFGVTGGRIGRAQDNDWVLPDTDRYVSSHHCKVSFRAGQWILEDTSTNGVFINGSDTPVSLEGPYHLQDGDRLRLGEYEIIVSIDERNDFPPDASGQLPAPPRVRAGARASAPVEDLGEELDLTDLLSDSMIARGGAAIGAPAAKPAAKPAQPFDLAKALGLEESGGASARSGPAAPPARGGFVSLLESEPDVGAQQTIAHSRKSDDWRMQTRPYDRKTLAAPTSPAALAAKPERTAERSARTEHPDAPRARRTAEPSLGGDVGAGVEAFCRGTGIDPQSLPSDAQNALLTLAGQMLREVVLGLMEALKSRADMKSRLRLSQTAIQPGENNPLKFSASVDEAVRKLLDPHGSRYLGPIEAIRESFADLRLHQSALASAVQAAADELMSRIEPRELQERFDRGLKRGALLGAANKMKYWDLYVEFYQALNQRNEQGLPTLFAEEMARTYAERCQKKKSG
ncbi:MAG TPA: type VI secretion system-associated FHA domain protein TagH [Steroidobacter sp.]|nr:type VI secretion system-associated FHA domain protein TagH [Steroidobacter sp.]